MAPDPAYRGAVETLAAQEHWSAADLRSLAADLAPEWDTLAALLDDADLRRVRLCTLLASGADAQASTPVAALRLRHALLRAACTIPQEAEALACLLAPARLGAEWWPALLMLAGDPDRPLPVRGAAVGRLLEDGCSGAWPVARSLLRAGTAVDEPAPWADWKRGGRYELPKRLLVISLDRVLPQPCGFEPNAAWASQAEQLVALESAVAGLPTLAPEQVPATWLRLLDAAGEDDRLALRALGMLTAVVPADSPAWGERGEDARTLLAHAASCRPR